MTLLLLQHFWRNIIWCTAYCASFLVFKLELGRQTEITRLHLHLLVQEEVAQLQISMDHSMLVHVLDGLKDLLAVALDLELGEPLAALDLLIQGRVAAELHDDVDIIFIFEKVLKLNNVCMVHGAMYTNLTLKLLLGSRFGQRALWNDLDRLGVIQLHIANLIDLREAALPQEVTLHVLLGEDLSRSGH